MLWSVPSTVLSPHYRMNYQYIKQNTLSCSINMLCSLNMSWWHILSMLPRRISSDCDLFLYKAAAFYLWFRHSPSLNFTLTVKKVVVFPIMDLFQSVGNPTLLPSLLLCLAPLTSKGKSLLSVKIHENLSTFVLPLAHSLIWFLTKMSKTEIKRNDLSILQYSFNMLPV